MIYGKCITVLFLLILLNLIVMAESQLQWTEKSQFYWDNITSGPDYDYYTSKPLQDNGLAELQIVMLSDGNFSFMWGKDGGANTKIDFYINNARKIFCPGSKECPNSELTTLRDIYPVKKGDILRWLFTTNNLGHNWTATVAIPTQSAIQPPLESNLSNGGCAIDQTSDYEKSGNMSKLTIHADKSSPQEIGTAVEFIAELDDPNINDLDFRYYLNGQAISDWSRARTWFWKTTDKDIGSNQIEVRSRARNSENLVESENSASLSYDIGIIVEDAENLQKCINLIQSDRIPVIIINNSIYLKTTLEIGKSIKLIGQSKNSMLKPSNGNRNDAIWIYGENCTVKNITIDGFPAGIKLIGVDKCLIENTKIDASMTAIYISDSNYTKLISNTLSGDNLEGILLYMENCSFAEIKNNTLYDCYDSAKLKQINNSKMENNSIFCSYVGIEANSCKDTSIMNNYFGLSKSNPKDAYSLRIRQGCEDLKIENNTIEGNACDDNDGNKWIKNIWKNSICSEDNGRCIKGCKSSMKENWDSDPICN